MSESDAELTPQEYADVSVFLTTLTGVRLTAYHSAEILSCYPNVKEKISRYGLGDSEVRESLSDSIARYFLGRDWPNYGEGANMDEFIALLKTQAVVMGYAYIEQMPSEREYGMNEDWQIVIIAGAWVEEVDCNSGRRRRVYSDGRIEDC